MDIDAPLPLLGGLSPTEFMRRHWQKKPLVVRGAWPGVKPPLQRAEVFDLAGREDVESRLVVRDGGGWQVRHGPLPRRSLPAARRPAWTLLLQGLDLHVPAAHAMLEPFRFVPAARLDDLMLSWASEGGGVGPHLDAYDVFLIQVQGKRRWRYGRARTAAERAFVPGLPLKILQRFEPSEDHVFEPGDLLYLPPGWAHDGVAVEGECMTASVGFRTPMRAELAAELLPRLLDEEAGDEHAYADPAQPATDTPGLVPPAMLAYARAAAARALAQPGAIERALGECLTEPKPRVWFEAAPRPRAGAARALRLDARTRMLYDARNVYVNGESYRVGGRDAALLRRLADARGLAPAERARLSVEARSTLDDWVAAGWLHECGPDAGEAGDRPARALAVRGRG